MPVDMMYGVVRSGQNDELMHYGRSKRDGAPKGSGRYPLGSGEDPRAPLTAEQKQEAIARGNARVAAAHLGEFTNDELNELRTRFQLEKSIKDLDPVKVKSGWDKIDELAAKAQKAKGYIETGIGAYNSVVRVLNSTAKTNLPPIKDLDKLIPDQKKAAEIRKALAEATKAEMEIDKMKADAAQKAKDKTATDERAKKEAKDKEKADRKAEKEAKREAKEREKESKENQQTAEKEPEHVEAEVVYEPPLGNTSSARTAGYLNAPYTKPARDVDTPDVVYGNDTRNIAGFISDRREETVDEFLKRLNGGR